jgi:hypothetical protein
MIPPLALACIVLLAGAAEAEILRVPVTADNSIVIFPGEEHLNAGSKERIRIKGNQHLVALAFDAAPLRGRLVRSAVLVCRWAEHEIDAVTVSTIQAPWDERRSNAVTAGLPGVQGWGRPGARFPAVTGSNGFSLACHSPSVVSNEAYRWQVHPDLIHACAIGAAYGLTLHEASADYSRNPTIWSREARGREPHLVLEVGGPAPPPDPPAQLRLTGNGDPDGLRLCLRAPRRGFTYEVLVNGRPLPRWNVPFVRPGAEQVIPVRDIALPPGEPVELSVVTLNRTGERSSPVSLTGRAPAPLPLPEASVPELIGTAEAPDGIAVIPIEDKYDARGRPVGDLPADYSRRNAVFDGTSITLRAARGEVVGFQVLVKGEGVVQPACRLPGLRTDLWRGLYVETDRGRIPDPLVPLGRLNLSGPEPIPVVVDVYVPFDHPPGEVKGAFTLSDGRELPVRLTVRDFAIPRRASFLCEMNSYGLPDSVEEFYRLQRIAYDHRAHCNILHYAHRTAAPGARKCNMDMKMASGRRMDERRYNDIAPAATGTYWDDFVEAFGPYLSGECFRDGHRGPVPAPGFYLTFHESWPLNCRAYFDGNPDAYEAFSHAPVYRQTFVNLMRDFIRLANRHGWPETGFQVYLNNKGSLNDPQRAPWILDEPTEYWDYRALAYFADLTRQARGPAPPVRLDYRVDISRPQFDRGQLWGKADLWVVNMDAFRKYPRLLADRRERSGERIWVYGTSNSVEESNRTIHAWVLEAYRGGAAGLVPWQTINRDGSALRRGDQLGIFILDRSREGTPIHHSMRLKAYRRAEQDVEYLELLRRRLGLTAGQVRALINRHIDLAGEVGLRHAADAGTVRYDRLDPEGFRRLREAAAALLAGA